uniref:WRKY transcription factor n=1 Tax=Fagopyrum tataricum TaxID=62330 RepID=A0A4P9Q2W1_FAGTA|nr:WRKY transcription factor [Fagopyrum tataricum]QGT76434.1 WRKY10 [Fagopyrum tataricum]
MNRARSFDDRLAEPSADQDALSDSVDYAPEPSAEDEVGRGGSIGGGKLRISNSPCMSIPPDPSPSSFLEPPVLISNIKVEPSPTTGSFCEPQIMHGYGGSKMFSIINTSGAMSRSKSNCLEFAPTSGSNSAAIFSHLGPLACADISNQQSDIDMQVEGQSLPHYLASSKQTDSDESNQKLISDFEVQAPHTDQSSIASTMNETMSDDGYTWRKYGQKLVKGCEYPRSYYKCAYPNCEVKKLFERAPDGQIPEIIYKGSHDHPKPQPNRRLTDGSVTSIQENRSEKFSSLTEKNSTISGQMTPNKDPTVTAELSPTIGIIDDVEAGTSQLNRIPDDADDTFVKRRKMEMGGLDINPIFKPIREPRVVVQTLSEVDVLDDGYRWRKYGQKVVRGNPNPRSYYKCTSTGCSVRKHVERASHDFKAVITTYEGKHIHDVPVAKNSIYDSTASLASRARLQEGENVSLHLGVGISSSANNNLPDQHQAMEINPSSNLLFLHSNPLASFPSYLNGSLMMHGIREHHEGLHVLNPPSSHSTRTYPQNLGKLVMGP